MRRVALGGLATILLLLSSVAPATAATYSVTRCGNTSGRVLITFDDWNDADPYSATAIGARLKGRGVRAAFFLIGSKAEQYPDIVATLRQQGHWVANHTYSHKRLTQLSDAAVRSEITKGVKSNRLRPPFGDYDSRVSAIASSLGYRICMWTIEPGDHVRNADGELRSAANIRSRVRSAPASAKTSGVILGHLATNYPAAVPGIIDDLHADGYRLCRNTGPVGASMPFPLSCNP